MLLKQCRLCTSDQFQTVIDLGFHPLADTFLQKAQLLEKEVFYPLRVAQCESCGYLAEEYVVSAQERYQKNDYSYDSANSSVAVDHFAALADDIVRKTNLSQGETAVDIGSNIGTLLTSLKEKSGCNVIGVEPSFNIAKEAEKNGVKTIPAFFNDSTAQRIAAHRKVKVITATNVFNHVENVDEFVDSALAMLQDDGVMMIEVPYIVDLLEKTAFDTIYLEHVSYFAVKPHYNYFQKKGLYISSITQTDYMGGSIRVYLSKKKEEEAKEIIDFYIKKEEELGVYSAHTYELFMERTRAFKQNLCKQLYALKAEGNTIIGVGAATKGNTLLNYCKIDDTLLDYIAENSLLKIGKYTPGSHIKIIDEKEMGEEAQYVLILPWNIGAFLKKKFNYLKAEFIVPHM